MKNLISSGFIDDNFVLLIFLFDIPRSSKLKLNFYFV